MHFETFDCDIDRDSEWIHVSPGLAATHSILHVQEAGRFRCSPRYYTERENHDSMLLLLCTGGEGLLRYEGRDHRVLPGQAFFIDCLRRNRYESASPNGWETLWVHFKGAGARAWLELYASAPSPVTDVRNPAEFQSDLLRILEISRNPDPDSDFEAALLLTKLMTALLTGSQKRVCPPGDMPDYLRDLLRTLDTDCSGSESLDELALRCRVSKFHLEHAFRRHVGVSLHEYRIRLRIRLARELLSGTALSVAEVGERVGLEDVSYFIRLFKRRVGLTPLAYRRQWRLLE